MSNNTNLLEAVKNPHDEFYTQLKDIEKELKNYKKYFKDKVVYCNCDHPKKSKFFHYFFKNFKKLKLKKLISSCYVDQNLTLFDLSRNPPKSVYTIYDGTGKDEIKDLNGDGHFSSSECLNLLKQADIVVTNPPFSLFQKYLKQIIEHEKKFIIMGNLNALTYSSIKEKIETRQIWLGHSIRGGGTEFQIPDDYPLKAVNQRRDGYGRRFVSFGCVRWFTNLDHGFRPPFLLLNKKYHGNEDNYPKYDNFDAINVDRVKDIPMDYKGYIGVPITFLDKANYWQFRVEKFIRKGYNNKDLTLKGKYVYHRLLVKRNGNYWGKITQNLEKGVEKLNLKDIKGAIKDFTTAIKIDPACAKAYHLRSQANYLLDRNEQFLDDLKKYLNLKKK